MAERNRSNRPRYTHFFTEAAAHRIAFNTGEGIMVNATQMAKPFGKEATQFLMNKQTKAFMNVLEAKLGNPSLRIVKGGSTPGTWRHQKLAL